MRVLYIVKHNPYGIGGGCRASFLYLMAFREIFSNAKFDILTCEEYVKDFPLEIIHQINVIGVSKRNIFSKMISPLTGILHRYQAKVLCMIGKQKYDICIFDHNAIAGSLVKDIKKKGIKSLVINHNLEADYFRDNTTSLIKRLLILPQVIRNEKKSYLLCDYNLFLTSEDRNDFYARYGLSNTKSLVRYVYEYKDNRKFISNTVSTNSICITGSLNNIQNVDGINDFVDQIYPLLPPCCNIVIAGKNPSVRIISKLKQYSNINLIANPVDIDKVVNSCCIYMCPTKLGSGIKVRLTDAFRNGLPVIAHVVSARGYSQFEEAGYLISYYDMESFAKAYSQMQIWIKKNPNYKSIIKAYYLKECSFEKSVSEISSFLKELI